MSTTVSLDEAQAKLKELIHQMSPGDELVITEDTQPIAKIVCERPGPTSQQRATPGLGKGMITFVSPDFNALLDESAFQDN